MEEEHPIPRDTKELLQWVDRGWQELEEALGRIHGPAWERRTPYGWRLRDVLAHMSAWEALAAERLEAFGRTGERGQPPDVDRFNARAVEERRERTVPELLEELRASHRALRAQVARLTPDELRHHDHWAVYVTAGNSYGHYQEHARELELDRP